MAEVGGSLATDCAAVCDVLGRSQSIDALSSLFDAMRFELPDHIQSETVIAFDANVLLRLSNHRRADDIIDHLRTAFTGRIILPGQVIQEFWNNQFQAVTSVAAGVNKNLDDLNKLIESIDARYGEFNSRFTALVEEFRDSFGYVFSDSTVRRTKAFIEMLQEKAIVPFMPRDLIGKTADIRKRTKTPPGFKDSLDGDFYVWSDLLLGLRTLRTEGMSISRVVFVTLDKKPDWSRDGVPHPILSAEIKAICGASFETLTEDTLARRLLD